MTAIDTAELERLDDILRDPLSGLTWDNRIMAADRDAAQADSDPFAASEGDSLTPEQRAEMQAAMDAFKAQASDA